MKALIVGECSSALHADDGSETLVVDPVLDEPEAPEPELMQLDQPHASHVTRSKCLKMSIMNFVKSKLVHRMVHWDLV